MNGVDFGGLRLNIEWSKKSGRFTENDDGRYHGGSGGGNSERFRRGRSRSWSRSNKNNFP